MKNTILIYDDNCPLCNWYSSLFVRYGFLPPDGRKAFSTLDPVYLHAIDTDRARNEIPLIDRNTGQCLYGIDALLTILGEKYHWILRVGQFHPLYWLLKKFYKFISYNRKVIVAKKCSQGSIDCTPDLNYTYRILFMFVCLVFNTAMLFPLQGLISPGLSGNKLSISALQSAHFSLVLVNCLLALCFNKRKGIEYLGQVNMLALLTILLLVPLLLLELIVPLPSWFVLIFLSMVSIIIFREYLRRMDYAGILVKNKWIVSINLVCIMGFLVFILR